MIGEEVKTSKGKGVVVGTHDYNGEKSVMVQGIDVDFYERIPVSELNDAAEPGTAVQDAGQE